MSLQRITNIFIHSTPPLQVHYSPINTSILLLIRIIAALYLTGFYIYDFLDSQTLLNRFIYLTNVGYFLTWLYFILILQCKFINCAKGIDQYCQIIFQTIFCAEMFITLAYWAILYTQGQKQGVKFKLLENVNWHGVPLLFLLLDFIFNSYRFILKQFCSYLVLVFVYMLMINLPYSLSIRPVYGKASDWVNWMTYTLIVVGILVGFLTFLFGMLIYKKCKQEKISTFITEQLSMETINKNVNLNGIANVNGNGNGNTVLELISTKK